jgi:anti-anti-sigma factor
MAAPRNVVSACETGLGLTATNAGSYGDDSARPATAFSSSIEVRPLGHAAIVTVRGDFDVDQADFLRAALAQAIGHHGGVVLNFAEVGVIDSVGLGVLVRAHRDARRSGRQMCLVSASRFIVAVLHTMRIDAIFPRFDSCEEALAWLAAPPLSR